jgi:pyruvate dehydrogenase E2 component (dihydrolipoamide acetyltransferase)
MTEFKLPELGENIETGDVVNVLVAEGDTISVDDPVLEIETDKATIEVPSSVTGVVKTIHVVVGDTIQVGQTIFTAEDGGGVVVGEESPEPVEVGDPEQQNSSASDPDLKPAPPPSPEPPVVAAAAPDPAVSYLAEVTLPELGENIETGTVVRVLVSAGDVIALEQGVLELETDKATIEVPSSAQGQVKEMFANEGDEIAIGQVILTVEAVRPAGPQAAPAGEPIPAADEGPLELEPELKSLTVVRDETISLEVSPDWSLRPEQSSVPAAPNVRRIAREIGVDVARVPGSGPDGRISMGDVKRYAREMRTIGPAVPGRTEPPPLPDFGKWGQVERKPMSGIRRATARHMDIAWSTIPQVTQFDKADVTDLENLRRRFGGKVEEAGGKLTITAILLKVAAAALKEFPQFNASIDMAREELVYKQYYHIGVAVDTDRGLLVPVIRDVDQKNIIELAVELGEFAEKARSGKLSLDEMQGGSFTITNLGGIGGTNFTPIVNLPEVAILGVARGRQEPVLNDSGQFEPRLMLPLALSYDHRLIDGADGARFLRWVVEYLEQPFLTALQGW